MLEKETKKIFYIISVYVCGKGSFRALLNYKYPLTLVCSIWWALSTSYKQLLL